MFVYYLVLPYVHVPFLRNISWKKLINIGTTSFGKKEEIKKAIIWLLSELKFADLRIKVI
jgi:hypothetical protein